MNKKSMLLDGSEKSMIPILKSHAAKLYAGGGNLIPLEEFSGGTGISDLTIFTVDDRLLKARKTSSKQPVTNRTQIEVLLALIGNEALTIADVMERVTVRSAQTVTKALERLTAYNLAVKHGDRYSAAYDLTASTSDNIIAIEAKVRDWKSGVRQAMRYKEYADYSYLAIYEDNIAACLANIEIFKRLGIGLIGVSDEGIQVHLKASLSDMTTVTNKVLAFERFISVVDERYEAFIARNGFAANNA